jgi:hypothetical protein
MKEKNKLVQELKTVMNAVNYAVNAVQLSMEADSPSQVFEVYFKMKDKYLRNIYRVVIDPNYMECNSHFVYNGKSLFSELMGFASIQKNGKAFVVSQYWFGRKNTITFNDENTELVDVIYHDANTPEAYQKIKDQAIDELIEENLPF